MFLAGTEDEGNERDVGQMLASVESTFSDLVDLDCTALGEDVLCDQVLALERIRRRLDGLSAAMLTEVERRGTTDREYGLRTHTWLAKAAELPSRSAKTQLRVAVRINTVLPRVGEALREGRIAFNHAKTISDSANPRIIEEIEALSGLLIEEIQGVRFETWHRQVRTLAELLDQDGGHDPNNDIEANQLRLSRCGDALLIEGQLVGEQALIAEQALNTIADELFDRFARDNTTCPELRIPDRRTLLALALTEALRRGLANGSRGRAPHAEATLILTPGDGRQPDAHEGLTELLSGRLFDDSSTDELARIIPLEIGTCADHADGDDVRDRSDSSGDRASPFDESVPDGESIADLINDLAGESYQNWRGMTVRDQQGQPLHQQSWQTLLCDPELHTVITDSLGIPVDLGRGARFASQAQRRAMAARDGGCVFPGCDAPPSWTDAHHVHHWEHDGPTDLANLLSLCRYHHGVAHRTGWSLSLRSDGTTIWRTPKNQTFAGQRHHQWNTA